MLDEYRENIRKAHEEISRWPKWKQGAVGVSSPDKHKSQRELIASLEAQLAAARQELGEISADYCHAKLDEQGVPRAAEGGEVYNFYGRAKAWVDKALAESQEREQKAIDLLNQIACRCTSELQDRSGQHVARVPGSRQWRDALYSIRLQIESMSLSQASAEER